MSEQQVKDSIANTVEIYKELPEPLRRKLPQPPEFPINLFPQRLKEVVLALHDKIQAPISICAQSVLAATNFAVQGHADVMLPYGQQRPISCFFLTIADSGERKSSCDNEVLKPIKDHEKN